MPRRVAPAPSSAPPDSEPLRVSDDVFRLQRRVVGSEAWRRRVEDDVVVLVNAERRRRGREPLRVDERLRQSARAHSADMWTRQFFAHRAPDGSTPGDRMRRAGYPAAAAENIARGQSDPGAVVHAWMLSPGHRVNILHPQVRAIGVGLCAESGGPWWTQHFGYE